MLRVGNVNVDGDTGSFGDGGAAYATATGDYKARYLDAKDVLHVRVRSGYRQILPGFPVKGRDAVLNGAPPMVCAQSISAAALGATPQLYHGFSIKVEPPQQQLARFVIYDPAEIRGHYLATEFTYDVFMSWPNNLFALALDAEPEVVIALRLLRLGLCRYLWRAYVAWEKRQADNDLVSGLLRFLGITLVASHMFACVWNALGFTVGALRDGGADEYIGLWPHEYNKQVLEAGATASDDFLAEGESALHTLLKRYAVSLYLALSMLSALGLNQLPANYMEIVVYLLMLVANMTIFSWTVGQISALVMKQDDEIVIKRSQLELVHSYLAHIDVSLELKASVEAYFHSRLKHASFSSVRDEDIAASMPIALQIEVSKHTNRTLVGEAALLRGCSDAFLDRLSSLLRERALEPETQLFREGDACKELYLIESGFIELTSSVGGLAAGPGSDGGGGSGGGGDPRAEQQDEQLVVAVSGETVGEISFIFGIRHFRNGRTASGCETNVFVLTADNYRVLLKSFPQQEDRVMDNAMFQFDGAFRSLNLRAWRPRPVFLLSLSALSLSLSLSAHSLSPSLPLSLPLDDRSIDRSWRDRESSGRQRWRG
jgi:CRP-like cAMP-binding protein